MPPPEHETTRQTSRNGVAGTSTSPVRGGTLPWGELSAELDAQVPWPSQSDPLPPASAVRGGTLPWGTSIDDLSPDAVPIHAAPLSSPVSGRLDELLCDSLRPRSKRPASVREPSIGDASTPSAEAPGDLASALHEAAESKRNPTR